MPSEIDILSERPEHELSLHAVMRPAPSLSPQDSYGRFLSIARRQAADSLPVTHNGRMVGVVSLSDVADQLAAVPAETREALLQLPLSSIIRSPEWTVRPEHSPAEIGDLSVAHRSGLLECVPIVDDTGYCLGMVHLCDLYSQRIPSPCPARVGGMATPFGVYLTDGTLQAGAGNLALVASGFVLTVMLYAGLSLATISILAAGHLLHQPVAHWIDPDYTPPAQNVWSGVLTVGARVLMTLPFFVLMRISALAGYHAAEHQTVHALEYNEPLAPEVVIRMPRAHPRCGTNLMAAVSLFLTLRSLFFYFPGMDGSADIFAALITLFTWRRLGTWLQERFTTRHPSPKQLASGIAAGKSLLKQFRESPPSRPSLLRRIWCMGLLQSLAGMVLASGVLTLVQIVFARFHP